MNKFRSIPVPQPQPSPEPVDLPVRSMAGGFRGDVSPENLDPSEAADLLDVRFETSGIRKDFGWRALGSAAENRILALIEHKFIDDPVGGGDPLDFVTFHRLSRIFRDAVNGQAKIEVWDGAAWVADLTSTETIRDVLLSVLSIQGQLLIADGAKILSRNEDTPLIDQEQDFPAGNNVDAVGESTSITVNPGGAIANTYLVRFSVSVAIVSGSDVVAKISFQHEGEEIAERSYATSVNRDWPEEEVELERSISNGDSLSIVLKSIEAVGVLQTTDFAYVSGNDRHEATKSQADEGIGDAYTFVFSINNPEGLQRTVEYQVNRTGLWETIDTDVFFGSQQNIKKTITIDGMGAGSKFGLRIQEPGGLPTPTAENINAVRVEWTDADITVSVHGFNKAVDLDSFSGIFYRTTGVVGGTFDLLSADAPGASFIFAFADRAVALRDGGDTQVLAWCASGVLTDWVGEGSGRIILLEGRGDPINNLMAGAPLSDNFAAIFRQRSIMRAFETGNPAQAIGVINWIEEIGTESPFSVKNVPGGIMFLGHDYMVYFLQESGTTPIGEPIQQRLIETVPTNLALVDAVYDPVFHEYILGVPENGSGSLSAAWIFDFGQFKDKKIVRWRKKAISAYRLAVASKVT